MIRTLSAHTAELSAYFSRNQRWLRPLIAFAVVFGASLIYRDLQVQAGIDQALPGWILLVAMVLGGLSFGLGTVSPTRYRLDSCKR